MRKEGRRETENEKEGKDKSKEGGRNGKKVEKEIRGKKPSPNGLSYSLNERRQILIDGNEGKQHWNRNVFLLFFITVKTIFFHLALIKVNTKYKWFVSFDYNI